MSGPVQPGRVDAGGADLGGLFRTEAPRLLRYFRRKTGDGEGARDLVQEAFARFAGSTRRVDLENPAAYLQRIARNLLFDRCKRAETRLAVFHQPLVAGLEIAVAPDQGQAIEAADVMKLYRAALDALPERTRNVFLLHRIDDLSYREIGDRLGISIPTVQYHVAKALAHIDCALERE